MTAKENFRDLAHLGTLAKALASQPCIVQASNGAAVDTKEMWVDSVPVGVGIDGFKSPEVVAQFGATNQSRLGHCVQISEGGRLVDVAAYRMLGNIRMGHWLAGIDQKLKCPHARRSGSQADAPDPLLDSIIGLNVSVHMQGNQWGG